MLARMVLMKRTVSKPKNKTMRLPERQPVKGNRAMVRLGDLSKRSLHGGRQWFLFGEAVIQDKQ
jgi:hypothetical protein